MIENLPKEITSKNLHSFNFGNIEANNDELLFESVCKTSSIIDFLTGKKNIVLGEKGTGKTALFRLLKEEKLRFKNNHGYKNLIIPIDDNFQYKNLKSKILKLVQTESDEDVFRYQIVWELFLFFKITQKLNKIDIELSKPIKDAIKLTNSIFGKNGLDTFLRTKKTFGIKLYDTPTNILPDVYFTSEPVVQEENIKEKSVDQLEIDLDYYKQEINDFLIANQLNVIVLIDRLDEFVSRSSIETQKELLEALIAVEREYGNYSNIELKIFLRDDLFNQLSFDGIGYDKVIAKKIDLKWTPENIREFIAKRLLYNIKHIFNLDHIIVSVAHENLEIDTSIDTDNYIKPAFYIRWYRKAMRKINKAHYEQKFPRKVNLDDNLNKQLILTVLPKHISFKNGNGKIEKIEIFDYLSQNFNLGTGNSIPRLVLIFLDKIFTVISEYYLKNSDELPLKKSEENCFELVKEGFFIQAYEDFKKDIYINFSKLNPEFEKEILLFKEKIGNRYTFRAKELKNFLSIKEDFELIHFCNYMMHIGIFKRINSSTSPENMKFELPIMFRN
jgi:DNA polymerase III delta prime subunit